MDALKQNGADASKITDSEKKIAQYYATVTKPNFRDYKFYTGESANPDGMYVIPIYSESPRFGHMR